MSQSKIKVLYISGWGRSGSTILGRVLGEIDGLFFAGELRYTWFVWADDRRCGCGLPFRACPLWASILVQSLGSEQRVSESEMRILHNQGAFLPALPLSLLPGADFILKKRIFEYASELERLYRAIHDLTGCSLIVDTSKYPNYGYILRQIPSVELYVAHLVRDPCAVAYSWGRKKLLDPVEGLQFRQRKALGCAITWNTQNIAAEMFGKREPQKYLLLRYEDFVRNPEASVLYILRFIGSGASIPSSLNDNRIHLSAIHTVAGNPNRFATGPTHLRLDDEWREKMGARDVRVTRAMTWPVARRYGYLGLPSK